MKPLRDLIDELHDLQEYGDFRGIDSSGGIGTAFPMSNTLGDPKGDDESTIQKKNRELINRLLGRSAKTAKKEVRPPVPHNRSAGGRWVINPQFGTVSWVEDKFTEAVVHTGAMIAFYPSEEVRKKLSQVASEDELHLTFIYLGKELTDDQKTLVQRTVEGFAKWCPPQISGVVSGVGRFNGSPTSDEGKDVVYASVDIPRLDERRSELIRRLKAEAGVEPDRTHGYTPHMTLRYTNASGIPKIDTLPISFDSITFKCGDQRVDFPLGGATEAKDNPFAASARKIKRFRLRNAMLYPSAKTRAPDTSDGTNDQKL